jgi:hypothetical protein
MMIVAWAHDDRRLGENIDPIGGVDFCRYRHEGDGAELRSENADPGGPPAYAFAAEEEVVGSLLASGEIEPDAENDDQVDAPGHVIEAAEA